MAKEENYPSYKNVIKQILNSSEASIRYKILVNVLGKKLSSKEVSDTQQEIKESLRVKALLSEQIENGEIPYYAYAKWYGAHWVLAALADIGYPSGDKSLEPLVAQELKWILSPAHTEHVRLIAGRYRRCGSQEGNALYTLLTLGFGGDGCDQIADNLIKWQWDDGGWNCDKKPEAKNSSFHETILPLRSLSLHARLTGNKKSKEAAERAAEIFLKRRLFRKLSDGTIIRPDFVKLHYPCYWHYDFLFGLKVMAEAGFIHNKRCNEALDLLESKRLPDGGFPAESKYYHFIGVKTKERKSGASLVKWGAISTKKMNEFVTADVLYVLKASGRLSTIVD